MNVTPILSSNTKLIAAFVRTFSLLWSISLL